MTDLQDAYIQAYQFAARAHHGQVFPGTDLPYIMHLSFVSMEVMAALRMEPQTHEFLAIQCALLHDTIEDTAVTFADIADLFGLAVAAGVLSLTKDKTLPKLEQMADCLRRIQQQPPEIGMVKMADRIANLQAPPSYWNVDKIQRYQTEAETILVALQDASSYLAQRLRQKIDRYSAFVSPTQQTHPNNP